MGQMLEALMPVLRTGSSPVRRVKWFPRWNDTLDNAMATLPPLELCPPELMRELFEVCRVPKRVALVEQAGEPLAVVPLKQAWGTWSPITTWVLPGTLFPARADRALDALAALDVPIFVGWWRQDRPPPEHEAITELRATPAHRLPCVDVDESYWVKSGLMAKVRRARRRCESLRVEVNRPGAAQWVLEHWGRHWAAEGLDQVPDTPERMAIARHWEPRGRHVAVSLMDGDEIAAAATVFVQGRDVIGLCNYRRREFDKLLIGTRLFDAVHQWAVESGMASMDFGSDHDYKKDWAPEGGTKWTLTIDAPQTRASRLLQALTDRVTRPFGG